MSTMNVSLPDSIKDWVEAQTRTRGYSDSSDYIRDLIRQDKIASMQVLVNEALRGGVSERSVADILAEATTQASVRD